MSWAHDRLGIGVEASIDDVKRAFRRLVRRHHPDVGGSAAHFRDLKAAYDELSKGTGVKKPRHAPHRADLVWGGCEVVGRTGHVKRKWGFVERVERQGAGLYNVFLSTTDSIVRASIDVDGHAFPTLDYQAENMVRVSFRSKIGPAHNRVDDDFVLNLGVKNERA